MKVIKNYLHFRDMGLNQLEYAFDISIVITFNLLFFNIFKMEVAKKIKKSGNNPNTP